MNHSNRTVLSQGRVTNVDFVVLFLGKFGPSSLNALYLALSEFRNLPLNKNGQVGACNYLFNRIYGYVSFAYCPSVPWPVFFYRFGTEHPSLWYRTSRGRYALNANGKARLAKILNT